MKSVLRDAVAVTIGVFVGLAAYKIAYVVVLLVLAALLR